MCTRMYILYTMSPYSGHYAISRKFPFYRGFLNGRLILIVGIFYSSMTVHYNIEVSVYIILFSGLQRESY